MLNNEFIEEIAEGLRQQYDVIDTIDVDDAGERYRTQLRDDTIVVANSIANHDPFYDMNEFYRRAGYVGPCPVHRMPR